MQNTLKNIGILTSFSVILLFSNCSQQAKETPKEGTFELTDSLVKKLRVDTVRDADNQTDLNFSAKITANEEKMAKIYPMLSGHVQNVPIKLGDRVNKGQLLATMRSAEMAEFGKEVISSSAELKNAQRHAKLTEDLYASGLASALELEQAKNDLLVKQAEEKRSHSVLKLNGGNKNGVYSLISPLSGFIIEKNVNSNMQVRQDNNESLFTVADLSNVWTLINIYESDISKVKEGDEVKISILSYPDKSFKGKISKIYNVLNNDSKVMNARVVIDNPGYLLKPGMMASVLIATKNEDSLPSVNTDCLIFDNNKYYVLVLGGAKKIRIQEVEISRKFENNAYISSGLNAGDRVVASRQLFLYDSLKP